MSVLRIVVVVCTGEKKMSYGYDLEDPNIKFSNDIAVLHRSRPIDAETQHSNKAC